jgi:hypothetical protein
VLQAVVVPAGSGSSRIGCGNHPKRRCPGAWRHKCFRSGHSRQNVCTSCVDAHEDRASFFAKLRHAPSGWTVRLAIDLPEMDGSRARRRRRSACTPDDRLPGRRHGPYCRPFLLCRRAAEPIHISSALLPCQRAMPQSKIILRWQPTSRIGLQHWAGRQPDVDHLAVPL